LKQKTHKKFLEFLEKMTKIHDGKEFEIAYSDIQRETGTASVTMKRALQFLQEEGIIEVKPGRNSRYAKITYLKANSAAGDESNGDANPKSRKLHMSQDEMGKVERTYTLSDIEELFIYIDNLRRRVRTQEIAIALLQDRLAEVEDRLYKL